MVLNRSQYRRSYFHSGFALFGALIFVCLSLLIGSGFYFFSDVFTKRSRSNYKKTAIQLKAEAGLEIAKSDLLERSRSVQSKNKARDFTSVNLDEIHGFSSAENTHINAGLVYSPTNARTSIVPRFRQIDVEGFELEVYYFPSNTNADPTNRVNYNNYFPKAYHVVSEATHIKSGERFTVESEMQIDLASFAQVAFGMLHPTLPPKQTRFQFRPALFSGHTHFGDMDPSLLYFGGASGQDKFYGGYDGVYQFTGPVSFHHSSGNTGYPFDYQKYTKFVFEKGIRDDYPIELNTSQIFQELTFRATVDFTSTGLGDVCLKYRADGMVEKYTCNPTAHTPKHMYIDETPGPKSGITTYSANNVFLCSDCNIWVKGIVSGNSLVAAQNIIIAGDIVMKDQSETSKDLFGAVAKHDIIIPAVVPLSDNDAQDFNGTFQDASLENIANFKAPSPDRDKLDTSYFNPELDPNVPNHPAVLDLEGAFLAAEGRLQVEGINEFGFSSESSGIGIYTRDGQVYNPEIHNFSDSYYYRATTTSPWQRRGEPMLCKSTTAPCPMWMEIPRRAAQMIKLHGSMVTNNYSYTQRAIPGYPNGVGFITKVFREDPRFNYMSPVAYPKTNIPYQDVFWVKNGLGNSKYLEAVRAGELQLAGAPIPKNSTVSSGVPNAP